jgi:hypothetical protein
MKVTEDNSDKNSKPMNFQINIGMNQPDPLPASTKNKRDPSKGKVSITIPTKKNTDGTYTVSND